ncbi:MULTISPECIES: DUF998 domain-containing protein [unclassified Mycobacterium]|uniref:DUF998 domain-containing protein n=1 Tax=unclassified Mycobacterium TaxID=2642494 RepID=UPI0029C61A06|nr:MULTISPECIES: DUF998 domain-containing protein [unclassified Mycobacterium]
MGGSSTSRAVAAGATLWVVAAVWYFVAEAIAAAALPGYDYVVDYVSVLGAPYVSPRAALMNAAFVVQGLFFPAAAMLVMSRTGVRKSLPFLVFATLTGVGNVLVGVIPAGIGSDWHLAGAVLAIAGGSAAILTGTLVLWREIASTTYMLASVALGATGLFSGTMLAVHALPIGLWERGGIYPILVWQTLTAYAVCRRASTARSRPRANSNSTPARRLPPGTLAVGDGSD